MKKTLIITLEFPPVVGGVGVYVADFAAACRSEDIVVLAPKVGKALQDKLPKKAYTVIRKTMLFPRFFWPRWLRLFWEVKKIITDERITHIHVHHLLPVGYVALLCKRFFGIEYTVFSHGTDVHMAARNTWKRFWAKKILLSASRVYANSENLKSKITQEFPSLASRVAVLYPCPNPDFLLPPADTRINECREKYALEGKKILLSVSRLVDGKGLEYLLTILPNILKEVPHLVWVVVGDGEKKSALMREVQKRGLQNSVRFVGSVPHNRLKVFYYVADVFALLTHPYRGKEEGLGLVFLEAAAAGLPVVAGRSGGVEEAVLDKKTGILIDAHANLEGVVGAVSRFMTDKKIAHQFGRAGKERVKSEFVWKNQVKKVNS